MKKRLFSILAILLVAGLVLGACTPKGTDVKPPADEPAKTFKVGLVTDVGEVDDKSFNQASWEGVLAAQKDLSFESKYIETKDAKDYDANIQLFIDEGFDVIVTDSEGIAAAHAPASVLVSVPFRISELLSRIFAVYADVSGRMPPVLRGGNGRSRTVLFCAGEGGCGCTSAAIGLCRELRRYRGCNVCYVSLESFGDESGYFSGEGAGEEGEIQPGQCRSI